MARPVFIKFTQFSFLGAGIGSGRRKLDTVTASHWLHTNCFVWRTINDTDYGPVSTQHTYVFNSL